MPIRQDAPLLGASIAKHHGQLDIGITNGHTGGLIEPAVPNSSIEVRHARTDHHVPENVHTTGIHTRRILDEIRRRGAKNEDIRALLQRTG